MEKIQGLSWSIQISPLILLLKWITLHLAMAWPLVDGMSSHQTTGGNWGNRTMAKARREGLADLSQKVVLPASRNRWKYRTINSNTTHLRVHHSGSKKR